MVKLSAIEQEEIYQEGRRAYHMETPETANPYLGIEAEYWSDGWEDAQEDEAQIK